MQEEIQAQPQDGTSPDVQVETTESTTEEVTVETPEAKTYSEDEFKQVLARAKRAEDEAKKLKSSTQNITNKTNSLSAEEVDVKILQSQGYSDELIGELKAVAKARGKSILASTQDSIFLAIKAEKEAEQKAQKAKLGASKGSGTIKKEKELNTPGLSDSEFKELWKNKMGR